MWGTLIVSVVSAALPFLVKLVTFFINKYTNDIQVKKDFLLFIKSMERAATPLKLINSIEKQRKKIELMIEKDAKALLIKNP